ncbi:MAG: hypothetical protein MRY63_13435 [Neomegalonema sp.]|nr:hypothetical protein [Neomegalonema sp.]
MPPRIPAIAVIVAVYLAVALGGGPTALARDSGLGALLGLPRLGHLAIGEVLAAAAAFIAVVDAALRPPSSWLDVALALLCLALAVLCVLGWPPLLSGAYGAILLALLADTLAGALRCLQSSRARARRLLS